MDENAIKKLIQQELKKSNNNSRFGRQRANNHNHDGVNSPKVADNNLDRNPAVIGQVTFATSGVDYTFRLGLPYTPRQVILNAVFVDSTSSPDDRYQIWGVAYLGNAYYLQPVDNRTVAVGGLPYPSSPNSDQTDLDPNSLVPAQSSTFFGFFDGASEATAGASQFHIADVFGSATLRVTVVDFSKDKIVFRVSSLQSGWSLIGNYLIT